VRAKRSLLSKVLVALGVLLVAAAAAGVAYPLWWMHRSQSVGAHLLRQPLRAHPTGTAGGERGCAPVLPGPASDGGRLAGIVEIPSLSLRAPVLQGLGDGVLNVAVGHDPSSPWPGGFGESVLEAHDVSYFAGISALRPGNLVVWRDACTSETFRVISHEVVTPGTFLHVPANARGLALITCYPTDALFWTPDRYVVLTAFVAQHRTAASPPPPPPVTHLEVPAPPALVAEGLTLQDYPILLGTLSITGTASASFREGPGPLDVEADALESFFGAEKAIAQGRVDWWRDLAVPGLAMPAPWADTAPYYVTIDVAGSSVRSVTLASATTTVVLTVRHGTLLIQSVAHP